jgi:hypothetical protein
LQINLEGQISGDFEQIDLERTLKNAFVSIRPKVLSNNYKLVVPEVAPNEPSDDFYA